MATAKPMTRELSRTGISHSGELSFGPHDARRIRAGILLVIDSVIEVDAATLATKELVGVRRGWS